MANTVWTNVTNSSLVSAFKYDDVKQELCVRFRSNGSVYAYYDISESLCKEIEESDSPGTVIHQKVIKGNKKYSKVI